MLDDTDNKVAIIPFVEEGFEPIEKIFLTEEEYEKSLRSFAITCTDTVFINREEKVIYLTVRKAIPRNALWWFGGRMYATESINESAARCLKRETGLEFDQSRFKHIATLDIRWKNRQQEPQNIGCHVTDHVSVIDIKTHELAQIKLDNKEYEESFGLQAFNRQQLEMAIKDKNDPVIKVFNLIFPEKAWPYGNFQLVSQDDRREIWEMNFADSSQQYFKILAESELGNHFHKEKTEIFVHLSGPEGVAYTVKCDYDGNIIGPTKINLFGPGKYIVIEPYTAHTFRVRPGTEFLCFSSKKFNPNDLISCQAP